MSRIGIELRSNVKNLIERNNIVHFKTGKHWYKYTDKKGIEHRNKYGLNDGDIKAIPFIVSNAHRTYYREGWNAVLYVYDDVDSTYYVEEIAKNGNLNGRQMIKTPRGVVPDTYKEDIKKEALTASPNVLRNAAPQDYVQDVQTDYDASFNRNAHHGPSRTAGAPLAGVPVEGNVSQDKQAVKKNQQRASLREDARYTKAVKNGDMETAQRMVDEAAKNAGYTVKVFHGTSDGNFTVFDKTKIGSNTDYGIFGKGYYFTTDEKTAGNYASEGGKVIGAYANVGKPYWFNRKKLADIAADTGMDEWNFAKASVMNGNVFHPTKEFSGQFTSALQRKGYDSVIV